MKPFIRAGSVVLFSTGTAGMAIAASVAPAEARNTQQPEQTTGKPNIIFILADDMGYAEAGCYGQKLIETPNIDALAARGVRFTDAYSGSPVSAPSRCSMLTGLNAGHAYIRDNDEWAERGEVWNYAKVSEDINLEGQRPIPENSVTIPKLLKAQGYATGCFGKWGLGSPISEGAPQRQGFDEFYGFNCQRQAHSYFPNHLWRNDQRVMLNNRIIAPGTKLPEGADPNDPRSYDIFFQKDYAAELFLTESMAFIERNASHPFFIFFSTTVPHKPIQAPQRLVERYVEKFGDEKPYTGGSYYPCRYPAATYAAMVSYLDEQVGLFVDKLKELGIYDNTVIVFASDNGPSYMADHFQSAAPFSSEGSRIKGTLYEGGIRVPLVVAWGDRLTPGRVSHLPVALYDLMPTFCQIAGSPTAPAQTDGISLLPEIVGREGQLQHKYLYWEFASGGGQQAVRMGRWKGLRTGINRNGNMNIQLFDLENDPQESTDLAGAHPDIVARMSEVMASSRTRPALPIFYLNPFDKIQP